MEDNGRDLRPFPNRSNLRIWSGIILLTAGLLLLAYKMGAPIPGWVFTWPVLLIGIGILSGVKNRFHNPGALIMILVGSIFLLDQTNPQLNFHDYILPAILIGVGMVYILRPRNACGVGRGRRWRRSFFNSPGGSTDPANFQTGSTGSLDEVDAEFVEIHAVFSGVKKIVLSKNFTGAEINCFMGGAELNLLKADINKPVALLVNNVFGGTKIIVPPNWDIKNEVSAIFGGIEDKRQMDSFQAEPGKTLVLKGTCLFGGVEVTNY